VILDWAGTTIDYGCFAPVEAFQRAFERLHVPITIAQARAPMGLAKKDHIRTITRMPEVTRAWQAFYRRTPTEADVDDLYVQAELALRETIMANAQLIPGAAETVAALRAQGIKIGSTTGYTTELMAQLLPVARTQGYEPDSLVCPDRMPAGRPYPWMAFQNLMNMGVYPPETVVKIGDTVPDILEGLNAGMWTIGIVKTGHEVGMHADEIAPADPVEYETLTRRAAQKLEAAGAHFIVDEIADVGNVIQEINTQLARGETP